MFIYGPHGHAHQRQANQSKREARHLSCILPGNMPAEKRDKQEEGKGGWGMNSRSQCNGNVQTCVGCRHHIVFLLLLSILHGHYAYLALICCCLRTQLLLQHRIKSIQARLCCFSVAVYITSPVFLNHYIRTASQSCRNTVSIIILTVDTK